MKRIVKDPDVRRLEIITVAEKLFEKRGYTKTSVESIIKKADIAKGTFYYYFKAKSDILQAIVERVGEDIIEHFNFIIETNHSSAIEKLRRMIRSPEKKIKTQSSIMAIIHKPENRELQEQLNIQAMKMIAPLITKVLKQGYNEGVFSKKASVESVQLILAGSQFVLDSRLFHLSDKKRTAFLQQFKSLLEQTVGAKPGALSFIAKE